MADPVTWMAISAGLSIGGGVYSYQSSAAAAKSSEAIGMANAQAQTAAARRQGALAEAQQRMEILRAEKTKEAGLANAQGMREQGEAERRAAQENIRRQRMGYDAQRATMQAAIAARGVVNTTGSPLELLVKTAETEALSLAEMGHSADLQMGQSYRAAALEEHGANLGGLDVGMALLRGAAAQQQADNQITQARLDGSAARIIAANKRREAQAGLVSSLGSTGMSAYSLTRST